jgi:hypothetical protein
MLSDHAVKRHLIILPPPPKKKRCFLGGGRRGRIFGLSSSIFGFKIKTNFGDTLEKVRTFGIQIGQFRSIPAELRLFEIQKIWDF